MSDPCATGRDSNHTSWTLQQTVSIVTLESAILEEKDVRRDVQVGVLRYGYHEHVGLIENLGTPTSRLAPRRQSASINTEPLERPRW